jgi:hypothetical protein
MATPTYVDLDSVHRPSTGAIAPATWGDQINDNFTNHQAQLGLPVPGTAAATPTRYMGGTPGGAPTSGTFETGDFVVDVTGKLFICTSPGTPGTWVQPGAAGPGTLLGVTSYSPSTYVQYTITSTTMTPIDSTNLAVTFTAPASGRVVCALTAAVEGPAGAGPLLRWGLMSGGAQVGVGIPLDTNGQITTCAGTVVVSGLTPGAATTFDWSAQGTSGYGSYTFAGPASGTGGTSPSFYGAAIMTVTSA